jgi:hypothetical protein
LTANSRQQIENLCARAFAQLPKENRLHALAPAARNHIVACLFIAKQFSLQSLDLTVGKAVREVAKELRTLAKVLKTHEADPLLQYMFAPNLLDAQWLFASRLSKYLDETMDYFAKSGHETRAFERVLHVEASELVRLYLGEYRDVDLEELFTYVRGKDTNINDIPEVDEITSEAIRGKRQHLADNYPEAYKMILERLLEFVESTEDSSAAILFRRTP